MIRLSSADVTDAPDAPDAPEAPADPPADDTPRDEIREAQLAAITEHLGDGVVGSHIRPGDDLWVRVTPRQRSAGSSLMIRCCNNTMPWMNASGRGGQPGT